MDIKSALRLLYNMVAETFLQTSESRIDEKTGYVVTKPRIPNPHEFGKLCNEIDSRYNQLSFVSAAYAAIDGSLMRVWTFSCEFNLEQQGRLAGIEMEIMNKFPQYIFHFQDSSEDMLYGIPSNFTRIK